MIKAFAALQPKARLEPFQFEPGPLGADQVEIEVHSCGICHSDLAMLDNEFHMSTFPFVPGHEVVGVVHALGEQVKHLSLGQTVGLGWYSGSDMHCRQCMSGNHNLCANVEGTIVGRYGGFADYVRCQSAWAIPLPPGVDPKKAGPLFCGGITVFNPIVQFGVRPTDRVGVIGIGGLGHLAIRFLKAWGCEVTAFSTTPDKEAEARALGAHHFVNSRDAAQIGAIAGSFDFIISTVTASLDWAAYLNALAPRGRLHLVGVMPEPLSIPIFPLLVGQRSVSSSPSGSPATMSMMLDFCARHGVEAVTETFPFSKVNEAMDHVRSGKARYRVVLDMKGV
jgi:alcohol/geraniol dehydrogenase (NADP+)